MTGFVPLRDLAYLILWFEDVFLPDDKLRDLRCPFSFPFWKSDIDESRTTSAATNYLLQHAGPLTWTASLLLLLLLLLVKSRVSSKKSSTSTSTPTDECIGRYIQASSCITLMEKPFVLLVRNPL